MRYSDSPVPMGTKTVVEDGLYSEPQERKLTMFTLRRFVGTLGLVIAVLFPAGLAQAQQPAPVVIPQPMPGGIPHATAPVSATPTPVVVQSLPAVPAAQAGAVSNPSVSAASGGNVSAQGTSIGPACNGGQGTALGAGKAPIQLGQYGRQCANGCGSWAGNCGFIFGSCRSFFDPCGPLPLGCKKCPTSPFGHPYGTGANRCTYDSYLNH
jgi:hypothetical protein